MEAIPDEAVEAAALADYGNGDQYGTWETEPEDVREMYLKDARRILEAAAPHTVAQQAVAAVLRLHRALPCVDEDGDPVGGYYCEECKDLDDHSGERVHEVYPCMTVQEITKALAGKDTFTAMRDRIEAMTRG